MRIKNLSKYRSLKKSLIKRERLRKLYIIKQRKKLVVYKEDQLKYIITFKISIKINIRLTKIKYKSILSLRYNKNYNK